MRRLARVIPLAFGVAAAAAPDAHPDGACATRGTAVVVRTAEHKLYLCESGVPARTFAVSLGRAGTGKQVSGDNKTPLGTYALGAPRASQLYAQFIHVGYPTEAQRRRGFTGGAVGIHGPRRSWSWLGRANAWVDWTRGCIAVASDDAIAAVADWVRLRRPALVHID